MTASGVIAVSIVIVSFNTVDHLRRCLASVKRHPPTEPFEIVVIDNNSHDGSADMVASDFPDVRLIRCSTNDGYGVAVNAAARETRGEWLLLLNPDIEVTDGAIDTLLQAGVKNPRVGVVGPRLLLGDGTPQASARRFPAAVFVLMEALRLHLLLPRPLRARFLLGTYSRQERTGRVPWVSGACHLIPRQVWAQVGGLTEETFCGFDDLDYCKRAWDAGREVWFCAEATFIHHCSVAVRQRWSPWEVEQVAIHSSYVVMSDRWPWLRVKSYALAECFAWTTEVVRDWLAPRHRDALRRSEYRERLHRRLALTTRIFWGLEQPRRRFQPRAEDPSTQLEAKP